MLAAMRVALATLVLTGCADPAGTPADSSTAAPTTDKEDASAATEPDGASLSIEESRPVGGYATPLEEPRSDNPIGTWYLNTDGVRQTLRITSGSEVGSYRGTLTSEAPPSTAYPLSALVWEPAAGRLRFRVDGEGTRRWFTADLVEGTMMGRFAIGDISDDEPVATRYRGHVTGWNATLLDRDIVPRTFDLRWEDGRRGRLQIDRAPDGGFVGTMKVHASERNAALDEEEQRDLSAVSWDGSTLSADVDDRGVAWHYEGAVRGRTLSGLATTSASTATVAWSGVRAEVLGHGMTARPPAAQAAWRERVRRQLRHMMMGDDPRPTATRVTVLSAEAPPIAIRDVPGERDDDLSRPQAYTLSELQLDHTLDDPRGGPAITRRSHVYMATPTTPAPPGGYPVVLAVNGHWGSARQMMDPSSYYWYGDGYARRGYLVVAVDISHRPYAERAALYADLPGGDDPASGNGLHPAIASAGFDTDWAEDGERAWDASRALDHALARPDVNAARVMVTGLSLGGEVATIAGALDPRIGTVVAAGFSPDLNVMTFRAPHFCWQWQHADVREYVEVSDYHAMIAPRRLVVETGRGDPTYSNFRVPFASDKQVLRRARAGYGGAADRLVHYLHPGGHTYRVGDPGADVEAPHGVSVPALIAPDGLNPLAWQTDGATIQRRVTVFDLTLWPRGR